MPTLTRAARGQLFEGFMNNQQLQYAKNLQAYAKPVPREAPKVYWYWGATGTGKTRAAHSLAEELGLLCASIDPPYEFLDPYKGEKFVIFDDVRPGNGGRDFSFWLRVLDRHPYHANVKHGGVSFRAAHIVVTSPVSPEEFAASWPGEDPRQLRRRITEVKHFNEPLITCSEGDPSDQ